MTSKRKVLQPPKPPDNPEILKEDYETKVQDFMLRSRKDFIETQNERGPKE